MQDGNLSGGAGAPQPALCSHDIRVVLPDLQFVFEKHLKYGMLSLLILNVDLFQIFIKVRATYIKYIFGVKFFKGEREW